MLLNPLARLSPIVCTYITDRSRTTRLLLFTSTTDACFFSCFHNMFCIRTWLIGQFHCILISKLILNSPPSKRLMIYFFTVIVLLFLYFNNIMHNTYTCIRMHNSQHYTIYCKLFIAFFVCDVEFYLITLLQLFVYFCFRSYRVEFDECVQQNRKWIVCKNWRYDNNPFYYFIEH